jgi:hypothetical protein
MARTSELNGAITANSSHVATFSPNAERSNNAGTHGERFVESIRANDPELCDVPAISCGHQQSIQ